MAAPTWTHHHCICSGPDGGLARVPAPPTFDRPDFIACPVIPVRFLVKSGGLGLVSYGQSQAAATNVDRSLRGAKPADLPLQLPTKYQQVINLKTQRRLGFPFLSHDPPVPTK